MKFIENCPVCDSSKQSHFLTCKDYTVSKQDFNIVSCSGCGFKFTNPRPNDETIGEYYKSEEYISHSNTNKGVISKLYHFVRNYTLKKKVELIEKHVSRGTILDYGCGTGMFLKTCKEKGWEAFGMEPDGGARKIASEMNLKALPDKKAVKETIGDKKMSAITLWHVLEHVTDLKETLTFLKEIINPVNGTLAIAVPNYKSYDANYYKEFWAAYDVPRHIYHFEINTVEKLLSNYGFKLVETKAMKFDSFYVSMLSEKYRKGSVSYLNAFLTGLKSNLKAKSAKEYSSVIYLFKPV